jgi:hypothetical protein
MIRVRNGEDDSRTLEALRVIARLLIREKIRVENEAELGLCDSGGSR